MKARRLLPWIVSPLAVLWFCACDINEKNQNSRKNATMSVNLQAEGGDDVKARLIFWREDDYHTLDSSRSDIPVPYLVSLPEDPIDAYLYDNNNNSGTPYNTGVPYPNTYEKLHVTGYAPQELMPKNGSAEEVLAGDYRTIPLTDVYKGGKSDIWSCSGDNTGSEEQPFVDMESAGPRTNLVFKHASARLIFKIRRDPSTFMQLQFRNVKIQLPDAYAPQALQWKGNNYLLIGDENDASYYGSEALSTRTHANSIAYDETVDLDTLYVATHNAKDLTPFPGTVNVRVTGDRSTNNFAPDSYIEEGVQWDIPVTLSDDNGPITSLQAGHSYVITITFMRNSFLIEAVEEDWEDHVVVDVQIINDEN